MTLPDYWFLAIAFLFTGYFVLEGFDFGVGMLMPIMGDKRRHPADYDTRRRVLLNTIGPVWDGNEVWLITAGAAMFAAFPVWYATVFSGFYLVLLAILVGLITRVCSIEWRGKINDPRWRGWADFGIGLGSWIPAFAWGLVFANILAGVDIDERGRMTSEVWDLLNPYGLLGGLALLGLFLLHGAIFVALKSDGTVRHDARRIARRMWLPVTVIGAGFAVWTQLAHGKDWTWAAVVVAAAGLVAAGLLIRGGKELAAFLSTCAVVAAVSVLMFGSLAPNVLNATDPARSISIADAASSHYTLVVMSWCTIVLLPMVMIYQAWTYWVFRKRISAEQIPPSIGLSPRV
ncbi:cytochrome d ubiquinol oxidase subunit II [Tsukamurella strandjordii]|uniref:Cytochrome d ubiquinol oxidase subunit II n=1 Tax=Tsukamurella strandjordii TaxID=147577 RepID=A0AA90SLD3_9ACTN|nr:cytochrome d ubiquinol oxidase subunit II [Tsukamurella strandjordii]MDP0398212.1 cytochrome d ubiquinol oxidase subunit II [Tsukamurella strandjordii]